MKITKIIVIFLVSIVFFLAAVLAVSAIGSMLTDQPFLFGLVRSDSMMPLFGRGDMVAVWPLNDSHIIEEGDIVVFKPDAGSLAGLGWIIHRVVSGNADEGFITKGEQNEFPDQHDGNTPPIEREQMVSRVIVIGNRPIVLPFIGYITFRFKDVQQSPYFLPGILIILSLIIGEHIIRGSRSGRKK